MRALELRENSERRFRTRMSTKGKNPKFVNMSLCLGKKHKNRNVEEKLLHEIVNLMWNLQQKKLKVEEKVTLGFLWRNRATVWCSFLRKSFADSSVVNILVVYIQFQDQFDEMRKKNVWVLLNILSLIKIQYECEWMNEKA